MKIHKSLIAVLATGCLLAVGSPLLAADTNTPPAAMPNGPGPGGPGGGFRGRMEPNVDEIAKNLNLTDDQKAKVKAALDARRQKMMEAFQNNQNGQNGASQEDRRAKRQAIMDDFNKQLKDAGLSQEQIDKLDQMMPGRRMRQGGQGGQAGDNNTGEKPAPKD